VTDSLVYLMATHTLTRCSIAQKLTNIHANFRKVLLQQYFTSSLVKNINKFKH